MSDFKEAEAFKNMLVEASNQIVRPHIEGVFSVFETQNKPGCFNSLTPKQQLADEMFDMLEHLLNVENLWHDYKSIEDLLSRARGEHPATSTNSQQED